MNIANNFDELQFDNLESGISVEEIPNTSYVKNIKVLMPKLMPGMNLEDPKKTQVFINNNMIVNDMAGMPKLNFNITTTNYLDIPRSSYSFKDIHLYKGTHIDIYCRNKNFKDMMCIKL